MTKAELALVRSLEAAVAELRERAEQAEQRAVTAEAGRAAERTRADALADQAHVLQAELATARTNARVSDQARIAAEHAHAEASVSLVALSEQLEAFEVRPPGARSAAWRGSGGHGAGDNGRNVGIASGTRTKRRPDRTQTIDLGAQWQSDASAIAIAHHIVATNATKRGGTGTNRVASRNELDFSGRFIRC
jgi:hypothetical protein